MRIAPITFISNIAANEEEVKQYYDNWAKTYERHAIVHGYNGHVQLADICEKHLKKESRILDVGAGTGLEAWELRKRGFFNLDGHDGSEKMVEKAVKRGSFNNYWVEMLQPEKMSRKLPSKCYDAVVNVGCFIPGCLNEQHIKALIDPVKQGGKLIIGTREIFVTPLDDVYPFHLERKFAKLQQFGVLKLLDRVRCENYGHCYAGVFFVLEVL